jgi:hypothetical protein
MDQSVMTFDGTAARGSAITTPVEGMVTYLNDSNTLEAYNSTAWVTVANAGTASFNLAQTLYFTSSGTFTKATYPWLRAIKVKVQGAGGGGGGCATTAGGQTAVGTSGGGGGYSESFITDITSLASSVTVTVGSGGAGGAAGLNNGNNGGNSSFGTAVTANGGGSGTGSNPYTPSVTQFVGAGSSGNAGVGVGQLTISGQPSGFGFLFQAFGNVFAAIPGGSLFGAPLALIASSTGANGSTGLNIGTGGSGGMNAPSQGTARSGGAGAPGIVIVELYA